MLCASPAADASRFLYAGDSASNRLFAFGLGSDGSLGWLPGFPVLSGQTPSALVPGPDGTHLYATFAGASTIARYNVNSDGSVSSGGSAIATGSGPAAAAISPDGTELYVANRGGDSISRYSVGLDGSFAAIAGTTPTGHQPSGIAMTPDGAHLYVSNTGDDTVSVFDVGAGGALTASGSPVAAGDGPVGFGETPDGTHLYVANSLAGTVSGWTIGPSGSLTSLGDAATAGGGARAIAVAPEGARLLVANPADATVSRFLIGADGSLGSAGTATTGPVGAKSVAIAPDGKHAYVGGTSAMAGFDMSALAALTPQANSPITTNGSHDALAIMPDQAPQARFNVAAAPTGQQTAFQGGPSLDSDGSAAKWTWDFGDGTTGDGQTITHVFDHAGSFPVTLTVADDEGCSVASVYTGSALSCAGSVYARMTQVVNVVDAVPVVTPDPSCNHDGDDGFCGTPDHKAPVATVLGFNDGATISLIDAPTEIVGSITPDPSGIKTVRMRFSKANGTVFKTKTVRKKVCRTVRVKGKKRRSCKKRKVVVKTKTKVAACLTVSGSKNYLVRYQCAKVPWVSIGGESVFRYELPIALGLGTYTVTIVVTDGAGNQDVVEQGRNALGFKVVNTPSNAGGDGSTGTGGTTTETPPPVNDTGSPFG